MQVLTVDDTVRSIRHVINSRLWSADVVAKHCAFAVAFQPPPKGRRSSASSGGTARVACWPSA